MIVKQFVSIDNELINVSQVYSSTGSCGDAS